MTTLDDPRLKFCPWCGAPLQRTHKRGAIRPVCTQCDYVHFFDPKVAVVVILTDGDKLLLGKRVMDPRRGYWAAPGGYVDADEDPHEAALREVKEETGLDVALHQIVTIHPALSYPNGATFVIFYRGEILSGTPVAADDVEELGWFALDDLPPIAFDSTLDVIKILAADER